jgi:chaperone required for assembly of F1-ATPase
LKRFYDNVTVTACDAGYGVALDGRDVNSPGRSRIAVPSRALARALAEEWDHQSETVDLATMPLHRLVVMAIDEISKRPDEVVEAIVAYGETDLTCYRAARPQDLADRQRVAWQPMVDWLAERHDVVLAITTDVSPVRQSQRALTMLRRAVSSDDPFLLTATHAATTVCGSVVIALALRDEAIDAAAAWAAAQLDETYQIERWGEDEEMAARRRRLRADLDAADRLFRLLGKD